MREMVSGRSARDFSGWALSRRRLQRVLGDNVAKSTQTPLPCPEVSQSNGPISLWLFTGRDYYVGPGLVLRIASLIEYPTRYEVSYQNYQPLVISICAYCNSYLNSLPRDTQRLALLPARA